MISGSFGSLELWDSMCWEKKNTLFDLKADSELPIAYFAGLIGEKKSEQERILLATAGTHLVCLSDFINDAYDPTSLILLNLK